MLIRSRTKMRLFGVCKKITMCFVLTTSLVLMFCAGSLASATPNCFNVNIFSFWSHSQNPMRICVNENCKESPYQLSSASKGQSLQDNVDSQTPASPGPVIHLSVVACGDRLEETLVMIKSAVAISDERIHVHIFADDELTPQFEEHIRQWPPEVHEKVKTSLYPITYPESEDAAEWIKLFKRCATQRLFIPYVVPKNVTDLILYVDTDILFMRPIEHIWNFFNRFNSSHIAALAPEHEWDRQGWYNRFARHPYYGERGVNSGVMLMRLSKMREVNWVDRMIEYHKEYKFKITWGDQDLINIFFHYYPEKLYVYPCQWNFRPDHCMYGLNCKQAEKRGVSIVHGNRGVYHNDKQPVFRAIYEVMKKFSFGDDLKSGLLNPLKKAIKAVEKSGYCGKSGDVFTVQLERQLKLRSEGCKDHITCDPFEKEDFALEAKLKVNPVIDKKEAKITAKETEKPPKESQNESQRSKKNAEPQSNPPPSGISKDLFDHMTSGLLKKFPAVKESKLLSLLIEHLTRLEDARDRHKQETTRPQENVDTALLPPDLHEDILGYAQTLQKIRNADAYLEVLRAVIEKLKGEKVPERKDAMHLAVVACGELLEQPIVMMKSAVLLSRNFLNLHVFAEDHLQPQFKNALKGWPSDIQSKFKLHIHDIKFPKKNTEEWKNLFKKCATQRLFLPNLMPDIDSIIYVDADILFLRPIDDLWNRIKEFNGTHIAGLVPEHEDAHVSWYKRFARHPYYPPLGVNSGVMPMNLTRMREAQWLDHILPYFHKYRHNTTWGDQDLINIFFHFFPEKLYVFPCDWNYRQDHCMYMHVCKRAEKHGVSILHGARGVYQNEKEMAFRAVYEAMRDYKFGSDLKIMLSKMRKNIAKHADTTNCGEVGWVLTKQLEEQIKLISSPTK